MNYAIIFRLLCVILIAIIAAFGVSLSVGIFYLHEEGESVSLAGLGISMGITSLLAAGTYFAGRKGSTKIFRKEALTVTGFGWILASFVGALPYWIILPDCSFVDALFESTSGLTTTGATVFSGLDHWPKSLLIWRSISQWIGGLGVVVFFVAILSFLGAGAKILVSNESSANMADFDSGRIQSGVLQIIYLYLGLSTLCALSYFCCGMNLFDSLCHMFTTVSTAGFSHYDASIGAFNSPLVEWVSMIFMILGGMSFIVMIKMLRGDFKEFRKNTETHVYLIVLLIAGLLLCFLLSEHTNEYAFGDALRVSLFNAISIMTTTGYTNTDFDVWPPVTHTLLTLLMIIGGCTGSTAGGLKVVRWVVAFKVFTYNIEKATRTRIVRTINVNGKQIDKSAQDNVMIYMLLTFIFAAISIVIVGQLEPFNGFENTCSIVISSLYNIGPAFDFPGPIKTYGNLSDFTKVFLSLLMVFGRLEIYAVLVLFLPSHWKQID